jgi:hypothetical protein
MLSPSESRSVISSARNVAIRAPGSTPHLADEKRLHQGEDHREDDDREDEARRVQVEPVEHGRRDEEPDRVGGDRHERPDDQADHVPDSTSPDGRSAPAARATSSSSL